MIPPTSHPVTKSGNVSGAEDDYASAGSGDLASSRGRLRVAGGGNAGERVQSTSSPVDKTFLLGFLNNVAKSAR